MVVVVVVVEGCVGKICNDEASGSAGERVRRWRRRRLTGRSRWIDMVGVAVGVVVVVTAAAVAVIVVGEGGRAFRHRVRWGVDHQTKRLFGGGKLGEVVFGMGASDMLLHGAVALLLEGLGQDCQWRVGGGGEGVTHPKAALPAVRAICVVERADDLILLLRVLDGERHGRGEGGAWRHRWKTLRRLRLGVDWRGVG